MCAGMGVAEDGNCSSVDGGEVDEEHVEATAPVVSLFWCALCGYVLNGGA